MYLARHDRITTWDMVDRAAPRVLGGWLVGLSKDPLRELAAAPEPLRRRSAITAPLFCVVTDDADLVAVGFELAARLAGDPDPVVHNAVGIFLKHAGTRDPAALFGFLDAHAAAMPRPGAAPGDREAQPRRSGALPELIARGATTGRGTR